MLWATAGVATLGFLVVLECAARHYGLPGPITHQAREVIFTPASGPLLYGGLALTMVVLTWRQRLVSVAVAVAVDVVFALVRWTAGADMEFGNGALWVVLGWAVVAVTRRTGRERLLLLKGVGLGLLLVAGHKTGDTWLLITSKTRPTVLDQYVATADHALGNPSWLVGRIVEAAQPVSGHALHLVYGQLPLAAAVVGLYQLRHVAVERRFPRHHLVRTFLLIGLIGPVFYMVFPVVGPVFAYGTGAEHWEGVSLWAPHMPPSAPWAVADLWPRTPPPIGAPHPMPFDAITPRNCMPSLHTAWATAIFIHSRKAPRALRYAGTFWLIATLAATLGFGYHYGADLIAGVVFALTIEAALRAFDHGWDRSGIQLVAYGATVCVALMVSYRYLPLDMARHAWLAGPLLLLALLSVIYAYVRTTTSWEPGTARVPQTAPQPELI